MKPDLSNVRLVEPKPRPTTPIKPPQPLPAFVTLNADCGFIEIEEGRQALARHFEQVGLNVPVVPVTIRGDIVQAWDEDNGHVQEFRIAIRSITRDETDDHGARFVMALRRIADEAREAGLSEQDIRNLIAWDFPIANGR